jgi:hypothetical protein
MKSNKISLLNPKDSEIERYVEKYENEWGSSDKFIYRPCLEEIKTVNLCEISEEDVKCSVRVFLLNWGMMGRVLQRNKGWEKPLARAIREICGNLEKFRKLSLEEADLSKYENDIRECYERIEEIVKQIAAGKVLHLICPNFFPLWDNAIREKISKESYGLGGPQVGGSPAGYYKFMIIIQTFLNKNKTVLSKLSRRYDSANLKIIDQYLWNAAKTEN